MRPPERKGETDPEELARVDRLVEVARSTLLFQFPCQSADRRHERRD